METLANPEAKHDTAVAAAATAAPAEQRADMVTPSDFAAFQQQLRQEDTDVMQQWSAEVNDTISGRMDSINTALQNVSARPAETKLHRISDIIPRNWEGNNEK